MFRYNISKYTYICPCFPFSFYVGVLGRLYVWLTKHGILRYYCHLPRCQIGVLAGLLSTSHFRLTDIPSTIGIPKPGKRVIANDGVSETGIKQLLSAPISIVVCRSRVSRRKEEALSLRFLPGIFSNSTISLKRANISKT